jgi:AraC-like DNA-binding protein
MVQARQGRLREGVLPPLPVADQLAQLARLVGAVAFWPMGEMVSWGRQVGASGRTLAGAFLDGTGITFGQCRRLARLQAALPQLATGLAVGTVARHVGYQTPSAFVAAFRKETGITPAAYFRTQAAK